MPPITVHFSRRTLSGSLCTAPVMSSLQCHRSPGHHTVNKAILAIITHIHPHIHHYHYHHNYSFSVTISQQPHPSPSPFPTCVSPCPPPSCLHIDQLHQKQLPLVLSLTSTKGARLFSVSR
ncbi:hypothetical protein E2C01_086932 [Portunus trituberculatus]|uniref:Uncharacterized protein n=1 Tax=Portunus trituberculatus TaxID=210409 RepID=A0A5B7J247_PORTR|nr:hypothetical protein [Portunus trituberculatus]